MIIKNLHNLGSLGVFEDAESIYGFKKMIWTLHNSYLKKIKINLIPIKTSPKSQKRLTNR